MAAGVRSSVRKSSSSPAGSAWGWLGLAGVVVLLDQFTKALVAGALPLGAVRRVGSLLNMVRVHNTGAAFSFLAGASGWQRWFFIVLAAVAAVFIVLMLRRHAHQRLFAAALAFILGGAVGNVIDRLLRGHVIDFIQVHYGGWAFAAFNLADSAITLGAGLLLVDELARVRRGR